MAAGGERNVETIRRLFAAVEARDAVPMFEIYDPDVVIDEAPALPYGGSYRGHAGMLRHGLGCMAAWDHLQAGDDRRLEAEFLGDGERVLVRWRLKAHAGDRSLDHPMVGDYLLRDGKVVASRMHAFDSAAVAAFLAAAGA